jgi:hypothetical protein
MSSRNARFGLAIAERIWSRHHISMATTSALASCRVAVVPPVRVAGLPSTGAACRDRIDHPVAERAVQYQCLLDFDWRAVAALTARLGNSDKVAIGTARLRPGNTHRRIPGNPVGQRAATASPLQRPEFAT